MAPQMTSADTQIPRDPAVRSYRRVFLTDTLHVFILSSFALAEPVFDRLSHHTVFLQDHGVEPAAIYLLTITTCVLIPMLIVFTELGASSFGQLVRSRVHTAIVFLLTTAIVLPVLKWSGVFDGRRQVALGVLLGAAGALAYRHWPPVRLLVTAALPALLVFPGLFVFHSPVSRLLFPKSAPEIAPSGVSNPVPVVMVVFDEFCGTSLMNEEHQIDARRYPNFAALAENATWYRNATTVHPRTDRAVPAILAGMRTHGITPPTVMELPVNLFTILLATKQYEAVVFEPYTRLFPDQAGEHAVQRRSMREQLHSLASTLPPVYLHYLLPTDLPFELPVIPRAWLGMNQSPAGELDQMTGVFRLSWGTERDLQLGHFLERIGESDRPRLYFFHVVLPHFPWFYLPSGRKYLPDLGAHGRLYGAKGDEAERWEGDELAVAQAYQRYLLQTGFADHMVGQLIERLRSLRIYDRCLLVVLADHGVSFCPENTWRQPTVENLPDIMSIPLFVKLPGQREGAISDRNVESIDVLPTILEILQFEQSLELDGRSFADASRPERQEKVFDNGEYFVTLPGAFDRKYETLKRMLARFGPGSRSDGLFRVGPHSELVGQRMEDLAVVGPAELEIELTQYAAEYSDDAEKLVPCYLEGKLLDGAAVKLPVDLAIAVNGTIRAVTRTYLPHEIATVWTAVVPESALSPGQNDFQVYVVTAAGVNLTLRPARLKRVLVTRPDD